MNRLELISKLKDAEINLKVIKYNLEDLNDSYVIKENIKINFDDSFKDSMFNVKTKVDRLMIDFDLFKKLLEDQVINTEKEIKELIDRLYWKESEK